MLWFYIKMANTISEMQLTEYAILYDFNEAWDSQPNL